MYGAAMGTLTVNVNGNNVFNTSGDKGNEWLRAAVNVNLSGMDVVRDLHVLSSLLEGVSFTVFQM